MGKRTGWTREGYGRVGHRSLGRCGWKDALELSQRGWKVVRRKNGSAELWEPGDYALDVMTKRSVELFVQHGGKLANEDLENEPIHDISRWTD